MITNFYATPLYQVVLLMILGTIIWTVLSILCIHKKPQWKKRWQLVNICFCLASLFIIAKMTLLGRVSDESELVLMPFYTFTTASYNNEAYRTMLMNVFLFFPLGLTLPWSLPKLKTIRQKMIITVLIGIGLSIGIECIQFYFGLGRAETDDVICNALGCMIGFLPYFIAYCGWCLDGC